MRDSKRTDILEAAARVVQRGGITDVTFDSVAEEAGLTKGGIMYHFRTRDSLLAGIHDHLAAMWEADMVAVAGNECAELTPDERLVAYIDITAHSATRTELLFMLEGATNPELIRPWNDVLDRWAPRLDVDLSETALDKVMARLAADGLWMYECLTDHPLTPEARRVIAEHITRKIRSEA